VGFAVGILTISDSYTVSMAVAAAAWSTVTGLNWLGSLRTELTLRGAAVVIAVASMPIAAMSVAPFGSAALERIEVGSETMYDADHQGDTRLTLWREAVARGLESRLLGLGPGPHLTSKSYKRPPPDKFESHNTPLELFTQGGLLASLAFVGLCVTTLAAAWRAREPALVALVCGFVVFSMFHFFIRHPIFWFGIVFVLTECGWSLNRNSRLVVPATRASAGPRGRRTPYP
jgi:O-antigen ligase